jgi:hypothetical protein
MGAYKQQHDTVNPIKEKPMTRLVLLLTLIIPFSAMADMSKITINEQKPLEISSKMPHTQADITLATDNTISAQPPSSVVHLSEKRWDTLINHMLSENSLHGSTQGEK